MSFCSCGPGTYLPAPATQITPASSVINAEVSISRERSASTLASTRSIAPTAALRRYRTFNSPHTQKWFARPTGGPDHRLIEHGRKNAAVDDPLESDVLGTGLKLGGDDAARRIDVQAQMQAMRIIPAANDAAGGVRERDG
ncbi:MAG TPA: hypothetical protein VFC78_06760 [Tepidisphaeraceae bacterium]|nr:hypothetical protein [Tepidisphaeraceae bacterium]